MSSSVDWCEVMAHIALTYDNRVVLDWFYHYSRRSCRILDHNWVRLNWGNSCTHSNVRWWWCRTGWWSWSGSGRRGGSGSGSIWIWLNLCGVCLSWNCSCWVLISCVNSYWSLECCVAASCCVCCYSSTSDYCCSSTSWTSSWRVCCRVSSITCSCNRSCINTYWVVCVNTGVCIYCSAIIDGSISCSTDITSLPQTSNNSQSKQQP